MRASLFILTSLCTLIHATPDRVKRQTTTNASQSSVLAEISSLWQNFVPPDSIGSELSAIPSTLTAALGHPSEIAELQSQILESGLPSWFNSLPTDAQNWIIGVAGMALTLIPHIASLEVEAGLITQSGDATQEGTSTPTAIGISSITMTTSSTTVTATAVVTKGSSSAAPSSSSKAGAAPTGVVAGVLGAIGILGVAIAL